ncbi:hypothetical protein F7725_001299 [Dissostichus mawsoni]|uniref:BAP29/BAP31 transmembrane domain-containing protein n=1 Tax=Dissostichus mawsoni TaxID=36200 RepID=A0A7J5ZGU8_DISMA|nr:hypothetical protein F7725_001299 [Dissostichus mawsoni]
MSFSVSAEIVSGVRMSLQWTAVATFLYGEVFFVLLLCIPFISPRDAFREVRKYSVPEKKLRDAGLDLPEVGKKGAGPVEENKNLKEEVKTLKEELDNNKKGNKRQEVRLRRISSFFISSTSKNSLLLLQQ